MSVFSKHIKPVNDKLKRKLWPEKFASNNQVICPKCGADRLRVDCPNPNRLDCGIKVEAQ